MSEKKNYEVIEVWSRLDRGNSIAVYTCLRNIVSGLYFVQNVDYLYLSSLQSDIEKHYRNSAFLFMDEEIENRGDGNANLSSAISSFESHFKS